MLCQEMVASYTLNGIKVIPANAKVVLDDGTEKNISVRQLDILWCLVEAKNKAVSFQYILNKIWQEPVTDSVLYQQMALLRKTLGDPAKQSSIIKTVPKKGYCCVATIELSTEPLMSEKLKVSCIVKTARDESTSEEQEVETVKLSSNKERGVSRLIKKLSKFGVRDSLLVAVVTIALFQSFLTLVVFEDSSYLMSNGGQCAEVIALDERVDG